MATTFPLSTYPLEDRSTFVDEYRVSRDVLDDGSMSLAVLGDTHYRLVRCVFSPLTAATSATFETYLQTNRSTEFDLVYQGITYTGYIWSDIRTEPLEGALTRVSFDFRGEVI